MKRTYSYLAWASLAALCLLVPLERAKAQGTEAPAPASDDVFRRAGVVDLDAVMHKMPDSAHLEDIDRQIAALEAELAQAPDNDMNTKALQKQIEVVQRRLIGEFKAYVESTQARLGSRKTAVEGSLKSEAEGMQRELTDYQKSLARQAGQGPSRSQAPSLEAGARKKMSNLMLAGQISVAQRRRELEHQVDASLASEKRTLEGESNARLAELMKAHQAEKLQLQLDLQTATDEDQRKKLQDRLSSLNAADEARRAEVRADLAARYDKARVRETARAEGDLRKYKDKVDRDISRQLAGQAGVGEPTSASGSPDLARLNTLMKNRQAQLKARFEAHKDALMTQLKSESEAAQAELKVRQAALNQQMKAEQKRLVAAFVKKSGGMSEAEKKRRKHLADDLAELHTQRDRVYKGLVEQVRTSLAPLAAQEHLPLVLCGVRVNVTCKDLTEPALKKLAHD